MKPILFNTEMVRAILDGRKTVARRVVMPQPPATTYVQCQDGVKYNWAFWADSDPHWIKAPYRPGDILYVREAFAPNYFSKEIADFYNNGNRTAYRADFDSSKIGDVVPVPKWHPSIHMPREAARIFLRVTDVRVERLQEIDEDGAIAEGCSAGRFETTGGPWGVEDNPDEWTAREDFSRLWDSTIKTVDRERYGWAANPWVWVIEFERCEKPEE